MQITIQTITKKIGGVKLVYALMLVAILIPYLTPLPLPIPITRMTREVYQQIEAVPPGGVVLMIFDLEPGSWGEIGDGAIAVASHVWSRPIKILCVASDPNGPMYYQRIVERTIDKQGKKYGEDYVMLGYLVSELAPWSSFANNIGSVFSKDYYGHDLKSLKMMDNIANAGNINLIVMLGWSAIWSVVLMTWVGPHGVPYVGIWTGLMVTQVMPYYPNMVKGIINSARGAAEYEQLIGKPGNASTTANVLSTSQSLLIILILVGNISYFRQRRSRKSKGAN